MNFPLSFHTALCFCAVFTGPTAALDDCKQWDDLDTAVVHKDGHIVLAGMFPIHSKGVEEEHTYERRPGRRRCRGFNLRVFRWSQAMIFFIEQINRNPALLSNITLGYRVYDTCGVEQLSVRTALSIISQPLKRWGEKCVSPSVPLIIGDSGSSLSIATSRVLNLFRVPLVSYFSSCACLSDKRQYPYFFRTISSDFYQADALARLVHRFGWTWVGTIAGDDEHGRMGIDIFTAKVTKLGICIAFSVIVPKLPSKEKLHEIVTMIRDSTATAIVGFAIEEDIQPVIQEIVRQNVTGKQWLASEAWVTSTLISTQENLPFLHGTIGFTHRRAKIPELKQFLEGLNPLAEPYNPFSREFWEMQFQCSLNTTKPVASTTILTGYSNTCTGEERIQDTDSIYNDVSQLRITNAMHKAVYTVAHALHNMLKCQHGEGSRGGERAHTSSCVDIHGLQPWQIVQYLREVNYTNRFGDVVYFDENGDPVASYEIINWQKNEDGSVKFVNVGNFDSLQPIQQQLTIRQQDIVWYTALREAPVSACSDSCPMGYRKAPRPRLPICCYDCVLCGEGTISNSTDQPECIPCPADFWSNEERNRCIVKETEFLSYSEPFGMVLAALAILGALITFAVAAIFLQHRHTPIVRANNSELSFLLLLSLMCCFLCALTFLGRPTHWSCQLRRTSFGISFALCLSCLLSKTLVVLMAFQATLPGNSVARWFGPNQQRLGVLVCLAVQVGICGVWLTNAPPYPVKNTWLYRDRIILECDLGSVALFSCVLGYIGCLAGFCLILAFLARKLPDSFNEAKFITFSMLIFCTVWITFIPAYVSSPGKFTVAVEIFAILASSFGVLLCIFAPKTYIIIMQPEKNSKKSLLSQRPAR